MNEFDTILRGGTVVDGTGRPPFRADVGIVKDRIALVGDLTERSADRSLEVVGKYVAPGFIDVHSHDDSEIFRNPDLWPKVSQGVTTVVVGNCGVSIAPAVPRGRLNLGDELFAGYCFPNHADFFRELERCPSAVNVAALVGHTTLRAHSMADLAREANGEEIQAMQRQLQVAIDAGVIGVSTGTAYEEASAATAHEIISVCKCLSSTPRILTSHLRNQSESQLQAIAELAEISRALNLRVQISHHKCSGTASHGQSIQTLRAIDTLQTEIDLGFDVYPYTAGSTILTADRVALAEKTLISECERHPEMAGRWIEDVVRERGCTVDELCGEIEPAFAIYFLMAESDVQRIISHPGAMIGSDGIPNQSRPHPRHWGTFPRVLGYYSRTLGLFPLEAAVRKMTGLPARQFRLAERGEVHEGWMADLTVFDPFVVLDHSTYDNPNEPAAGIDYVFVNGVLTLDEAQPTLQRPGRPLRLKEGSHKAP